MDQKLCHNFIFKITENAHGENFQFLRGKEKIFLVMHVFLLKMPGF